MEPGNYTISWKAMKGYMPLKNNSETKTLQNKGNITFFKEYFQEFNIISPASGTRWNTGETVDILWSGGYPDHKIRISLMVWSNQQDDYITLKTIASSTTNDGQFTWSIPSNLIEYNSYEMWFIMDDDYYYSHWFNIYNVNDPYLTDWIIYDDGSFEDNMLGLENGEMKVVRFDKPSGWNNYDVHTLNIYCTGSPGNVDLVFLNSSKTVLKTRTVNLDLGWNSVGISLNSGFSDSHLYVGIRHMSSYSGPGIGLDNSPSPGRSYWYFPSCGWESVSGNWGIRAKLSRQP